MNNTYALAMQRADAAARRIRSISDLAAKVREGEGIKLASTLEFLSRTDGLQPLQQTYGFKFTLGNVVGMDTGAIYNALRRGFDVGVVFATDGRISAFDLTVLRDDQGFFPSYLLTPVMREATLNRYPALKPILEALSAQLDNETNACQRHAAPGEEVDIAAAHPLLHVQAFVKPATQKRPLRCTIVRLISYELLRLSRPNLMMSDPPPLLSKARMGSSAILSFIKSGRRDRSRSSSPVRR